MGLELLDVHMQRIKHWPISHTHIKFNSEVITYLNLKPKTIKTLLRKTLWLYLKQSKNFLDMLLKAWSMKKPYKLDMKIKKSVYSVKYPNKLMKRQPQTWKEHFNTHFWVRAYIWNKEFSKVNYKKQTWTKYLKISSSPKKINVW